MTVGGRVYWTAVGGCNDCGVLWNDVGAMDDCGRL